MAGAQWFGDAVDDADVVEFGWFGAGGLIEWEMEWNWWLC